MQLNTQIQTEIERELRALVRTNAIFAEGQIQAIERIAGEKRGNGKRRFARVLRLVVDAGIMAVQAESGLTTRAATAKRGTGVVTEMTTQE